MEVFQLSHISITCPDLLVIRDFHGNEHEKPISRFVEEFFIVNLKRLFFFFVCIHKRMSSKLINFLLTAGFT